MTIPNQLQEMRDVIAVQIRHAETVFSKAKPVEKALNVIANLNADFLEIAPDRYKASGHTLIIAETIVELQRDLHTGLSLRYLRFCLQTLDNCTIKLITLANETIVHGGDNVVAFKRPLQAKTSCFLPSTGGDAA